MLDTERLAPILPDARNVQRAVNRLRSGSLSPYRPEELMYGIVRQYSGASALIDALERQQAAAAELLRAAPGFVA